MFAENKEGICRNKSRKASFKEFKKSASKGAVQQAGKAAAWSWPVVGPVNDLEEISRRKLGRDSNAASSEGPKLGGELQAGK